MHLQVLKQKRKLDTVNHAHAALDRFLRLAAHHAHIEELLIDSFEFCRSDAMRRRRALGGQQLARPRRNAARGCHSKAGALRNLCQ